MFISTTVISEPDDVTVCEGRSSITLSCVLNRNISSVDVQWNRLIKDTGTIERVTTHSDDMISVPIANNNSFTTTLYINTIKSYTGYYWVRLPSDDVCVASLTVIIGM